MYCLYLWNICTHIKFIEGQSIESNRSSELPGEIIEMFSMKNGLNSSENQPNLEFFCKTSGCIKAAAQMASFLDESVDPCENFYRFASGNYLNSTIIPENRDIVDLYTNVSDLVQKQLHEILSEPVQPDESKSFRLAKQFFSSCLNESIVERRGLEPLLEVLDELGGWPVIEGSSWSDDGLDWTDTTEILKSIGFDTDGIFSVSVEFDSRNSTKRVLEVNSTKDTYSANIFAKYVWIKNASFSRSPKEISNWSVNI